MRFNNPYLIALGVLVLLWIFYKILTGNWNPLKVICGADGRPSTSKLQFWMWTVVALFAYVAYYSARVNYGHTEPIGSLPQSLLIAMGLSVVTVTAAKGITMSNLQNGSLVKPPATPETSGAGQILKDDSGALDLSKIQMLAWTVIAIGVYLINLVKAVEGVGALKPGDTVTLPDIDAALMVLMGLGQGAYLGKKLVTTNTPGITGLVPASGKVGTEVTVRGTSFGASQGGSMITLDGKPFAADVTAWGDNQIKFKFPEKQPDGSDWPTGKPVIVGVIVGGLESPATAPFTVTA
jgi:hypothetical protein